MMKCLTNACSNTLHMSTTKSQIFLLQFRIVYYSFLLGHVRKFLPPGPKGKKKFSHAQKSLRASFLEFPQIVFCRKMSQANYFQCSVDLLDIVKYYTPVKFMMNLMMNNLFLKNDRVDKQGQMDFSRSTVCGLYRNTNNH